jgi:hypothetical protein
MPTARVVSGCTRLLRATPLCNDVACAIFSWKKINAPGWAGRHSGKGRPRRHPRRAVPRGCALPLLSGTQAARCPRRAYPRLRAPPGCALPQAARSPRLRATPGCALPQAARYPRLRATPGCALSQAARYPRLRAIPGGRSAATRAVMP